ncbi:MAG TPA: hypothetical protein VGR43_07740 [Dehalococcoidia bacterium]|jgi:hypothetical protein|nr:hypothetical protein [Dehalococcoidia bacterium]
MDAQQDSFLRDLTALAGVTLSPEREAALLSGLEGTRRIAAALSRRNFAEAEPAGRFHAPRASAK